MSSDPLIGKQLANYKIEKVIGRGGMAQVYYGRDVKLDRPVAIKVIDARFRDDPQYAERFVNEAKAVATWRHENVVHIYYADEEDGIYFFAMEYIDGADLGEIIAWDAAEDKLMPHDRVIKIGNAVASALDYAHERGVVHRDVKPGNIMIARDGRVVLTDFGLALDVQQGSLGETFGSPRYIAPEQARRSSDATGKSDLYSLGVILYEILTGQVPFDDPSPTSVALQHMTQTPPRPREVNPNLTEPVEAVLLKALSKNPADRYQTGEELMLTLTRALRASNPKAMARTQRSSIPESSGSPTSLEPPEKERSGIPGLLIAVGGMAAVIFALIFIAALLGLTGFDLPGNLFADAGEPTQTIMVGEQSAPSATPLTAGGDETPEPNIVPPTDVPTSTPPDAPTATPTATPTEVPTSIPVPTAAGGEYQLFMAYEPNGFYLYNPGDRALEITNIAFQTLDAEGQPTQYNYSGDLWASFYSFLEPERCVVLELVTGSPDRPQQCGIINARRNFTADSEWYFWPERSGTVEFRVLWDGEEVGRCETGEGICEVRIP